MRFVDEAIITVRAGKGGHGCVSFRREKFVPRGGPDGGNGGDGGSVYLKGTSRLLSLYDFRVRRFYDAENGRPGEGSQCHGRKGESLVLELPLGTQIYEITEGGETLFADLSEPEADVLAARGGRGGKGNEFFKSATMRAPRFSQPGEPGEERALRLELKILADCGLLGLPNAGKSTFISKVSAARPKIAAYPFTTLTPNLGVMIDERDYDRRLVIADIPGLIEGASAGAGLGHQFLRHVERTRFLLHILSIEDMDEQDPWSGFELINTELALFNEELAARHQIEVINKIDAAGPEKLARLREKAQEDGRAVYFMSALTGEGVEEVVAAMWSQYAALSVNAPLVVFKPVAVEGDEPGEGPEIVWTRE
ncbi:MAG: GTPase ObgE [Deltaproteobacteria bacterium]|jgi:GTP-binding protein|nr:GTPase ObgE [Deltaproteobacteria bacterium]